MFRIYSIGAVVCALFVAACSGGDTTGSTGTGGSNGAGTGGGTTTGSSGGDATVDSACEAYAKALCEKAQSCSSFAIQVEFGDVASCEASLAVQCKSALSPAEASKANAAKYTTCATKLAAAECSALLADIMPAECYPDPGTLAEGKPCGASAQCASTYCKLDEGCGVCATRSPADGTCSDSSDCALGLTCTAGTCKKQGAVGDACSDTQPCNSTLYCKSGTCAIGPKVGDACNSMAGELCDITAGAVCNPATNKCELIKLAKVGEACGDVSGSPVLCLGGATCSGTQSASTCVAPASVGAACDSTMGPGCTPEALCVNSVCAIPDPASCK